MYAQSRNLIGVLLVGGLSACLSDSNLHVRPDSESDPTVETPDPPRNEPPRLPTQPNPVGRANDCEVDELSRPIVFGSKIKNLLMGRPLTTEELNALQTDPSTISALTRTWMETEEFGGVMRGFLRSAFQQDATEEGIAGMLNFADLSGFGRFENPREAAAQLLLENIRESFARTVVRMIAEDRPWPDVMTADTFEMTTALMVFQAALERIYINDQFQRKVLAWPELEGTFTLYQNAAEAPPSEQAFNPRHARFLHIYQPRFDRLCVPTAQATVEVQSTNFYWRADRYLLMRLFGFVTDVQRRVDGELCRTGYFQTTPLLS